MSVKQFIINKFTENIKQGKGKYLYRTSDLQSYAVEYCIKHKSLHLASYFEREFRKIKKSDLFDFEKIKNKDRQNTFYIRRKKCQR